MTYVKTKLSHWISGYGDNSDSGKTFNAQNEIN